MEWATLDIRKGGVTIIDALYVLIGRVGVSVHSDCSVVYLHDREYFRTCSCSVPQDCVRAL
jgi:hypothetical protein